MATKLETQLPLMEAEGRLPYPKGVKGEILWIYAIPIALFHLLALLAIMPWFFSWTSVVVMLIGVHCFGDWGINMCYHRLLTHRSFKVPKWLERSLTVVALCCMQDTPAKWVANHRLHHNHSDEPPDPHSPLVTFLWGHFGWLMVNNEEMRSVSAYQKYARDILEDPFYLYLEKTFFGVWIYVMHAALFYFIGFGAGYWFGSADYAAGTLLAGLQFGLSLFLWGVIVRTVIVWHITWSVNSLTHCFGYKNYNTSDNSRNNWFVAAVAGGEGWHNNHHHDQSSCTVQHRWWEIDVTYYTVLLLKWMGLATNVVPPKYKREAEREARKAKAESQKKVAPVEETAAN